MLYISGIHALNIEDSLETCGDWHTSAIQWSNLTLLDSSKSRLKDWGIETDKVVPQHKERYNVANTLRAVLDLMVENNLGYLKGFRDDFFCTDKYNIEFFEKVLELNDLPNWCGIDSLMQREFMWLWNDFKRENNL